MMPLRLRRARGTVSGEQLTLLCAVAVVGVSSMVMLGGAWTGALATGADGRTDPQGRTDAATPAGPAGPVAQAGVLRVLLDEAALLRRAEEARAAVGEAHVWPEMVRRPINPLADEGNCVACAVALDSTLEGAPASARPVFSDAFAGGLEALIRELSVDRKARGRAVRRLIQKFEHVRRQKPDLADAVDELIESAKALGRRRANLSKADPDLVRELAITHALPAGDNPSLAAALGRAPDDWEFQWSLLEVDHAVSAWPDGAKGIVSLRSPGAESHVINVLRAGGKTYFLDAQSGISYTRAALPDRPAFLLRTKDAPPGALDGLGELPRASDDFRGLGEDVPVDYFANPDFVNPRGRGRVTFVDRDYRGEGTKCARGVNCMKVTATTDLLLSGAPPTQALPFWGQLADGTEDTQRLDSLLKAVGVEGTEIRIFTGEDATAKNFLTAMLDTPAGSKAVLRIVHKDKTAHFLNAVNLGDRVVVLDNQSRRSADSLLKGFEDAAEIWIAPTAPVPPHMLGVIQGWAKSDPDTGLVLVRRHATP